MRANKLQSVLSNWETEIVDTNIPFQKKSRFSRSLGFRFKRGPLIRGINHLILSQIESGHYELIWVDKGVYITEKTTKILSGRTDKLVHYTPDTAFYQNKSKHFIKCLPYYDFLITTKSFEREQYLRHIAEDRLLLTTQGFDKDVHRPFYDFENKENCVVFIGLWEPARAEVVQKLIDAQIQVKLAGHKWGKFVERDSTSQYLEYVGTNIKNDDYAGLISSALFSIGCVSKRFPELHTTRTFEIPACGTALLTERNKETSSFYDEDEVIFYDNLDDLINKVRYYQNNLRALKHLTDKGMQKVDEGGYDYKTILTGLLKRILN
jgi:spore maturation protein CgeB